jgi:hypothetical protein
MVIALAIGPKVRGFNPGLGGWIFKGAQHIGGEVKPSDSRRRILRHVKNPVEVWKRYSVWPNSSSL